MSDRPHDEPNLSGRALGDFLNDPASLARLRQLVVTLARGRWSLVDVDDVFQEVALRLLRSSEKHDITIENIWAYAGAITRNVCISYLRKRVRENRILQPLSSEPAMPMGADDPSIRVERADLLQNAVSLLDATDQKVLRLRCQEHFTHRQIAADLGMTEETVRQRFLRTRTRLMKAIDRLATTDQTTQKLKAFARRSAEIAEREDSSNKFAKSHVWIEAKLREALAGRSTSRRSTSLPRKPK